jgi:hypothetical protein
MVFRRTHECEDVVGGMTQNWSVHGEAKREFRGGAFSLVKWPKRVQNFLRARKVAYKIDVNPGDSERTNQANIPRLSKSGNAGD